MNGPPTSVVIYILVWLSFQGNCGATQPILTVNTTLSYVCPGENVRYECSSNTSGLIWNADPVVGDFLILEREINTIDMPQQFGNIIIIFARTNPLTSTLTIMNSNNLNQTLVSCMTADNMIETISYTRIIDIGPAPSNFILRNDSVLSATSRVVNVAWDPYQGIKYYSIFCPNGECPEIRVNKTINNALFIVNSLKKVVILLTAVDLCPTEPSSLILPESAIPTPTSSSMSGLVLKLSLLAGFGWGMFIVLLVGIGVSILGCLCYQKTRNKNRIRKS